MRRLALPHVYLVPVQGNLAACKTASTISYGWEPFLGKYHRSTTMGFRFRKAFRLLPGVKLNASKSCVSASLAISILVSMIMSSAVSLLTEKLKDGRNRELVESGCLVLHTSCANTFQVAR
jgi:hypothetical protein